LLILLVAILGDLYITGLAVLVRRVVRDVYLLTMVSRLIPVILELYAVTAADVSKKA
jgi:hypothetical protein